MGDVALSIPVITAYATNNPEAKFHVLTRKAFKDLFPEIPNLKLHFPDLKGRHKGLLGLFRLHRNLIRREGRFTKVLDLHDVLRSKILRFYFLLQGIGSVNIDKGRSDKKEFINNPDRNVVLKHTSQRYIDVFQNAGFSGFVPPSKHKLFQNTRRIGIAPFAQHEGKRYPINMMAKVAQDLSDKGYSLFIFGGGKKDLSESQDFAGIPQLEICVNKYSLTEEQALMETLDVMITMDSANMHIARLSATPVISIWGATHPNLGFHAFGQAPSELTVQIPYEEMTCRPCSIFGAKPCERKDYACMNTLSPALIIKKVDEFYSGAIDLKND